MIAIFRSWTSQNILQLNCDDITIFNNCCKSSDVNSVRLKQMTGNITIPAIPHSSINIYNQAHCPPHKSQKSWSMFCFIPTTFSLSSQNPQFMIFQHFSFLFFLTPPHLPFLKVCDFYHLALVPEIHVIQSNKSHIPGFTCASLYICGSLHPLCNLLP